MTSDDAERIALGRVGGRVVRTEREFEHGRWEWHVRIEGSGGRHDVRVDGETGTVCADDSGRRDDDSGHQGRGGDDSGHGNSGGDDSGHRGRGGDDH
ncbi:MAG TPA: PepSY domain-containing protein [Umezawaea sp.]|nr:PepSY domain-containing protein [Umezawaea sp.]